MKGLFWGSGVGSIIYGKSIDCVETAAKADIADCSKSAIAARKICSKYTAILEHNDNVISELQGKITE